ncbi:9503_t:CDS:2 [Acaulospora colombiana]|uniref:9503_t:CDS:1 n=1 Tax=Acaulospora colombiana TaxID=27376 RepID=A0ACA9M8P1_9GLOM|nr:9503_t:CDS:2 [Acaulospora colombiana]
MRSIKSSESTIPTIENVVGTYRSEKFRSQKAPQSEPVTAASSCSQGKAHKRGPLPTLLSLVPHLPDKQQLDKRHVSPQPAWPSSLSSQSPYPRRKNTGLTGLFRRKKPANRTAGYRAALTNPNTTHAGREHAKHELHAHGQSAHVPLTKKIERTLGIHQTSRASRKRANARRRRY